MKIGIVQYESLGDKNSNLSKSLELIQKLATSGAEIICLQELFLTDYFCFEENPDSFSLADEIKTSSFIKPFRECAKKLGLVLILSCFEKRTTGLYHNSTLILDADKDLGIYRKQHIPDDPGYYEKYYFCPGDNGYKVFDTSKGKIGVLICWDQWFPEAARAVTLQGAEIIFYPTAIGWDENDSEEIKNEELEAWKTIHKAHAITNGIPVVAVNRIGKENGLKFWGNSIVVNSFGKIVYEASIDNQDSKMIDIDLNETSFYRHRWPFLRDRRVDTYKSLLKRMNDE